MDLKVWSKLRHVVTVSSIIIPIILGLHIIFGYQMTIPMPNGFIYIKVDHWFKQADFVGLFRYSFHDAFKITAPLMNSIAGGVSFIIIIGCTLASVVKMCLMKAGNDKRIQMKVFLVACWMCSSSLIFGVYQVIIACLNTILKKIFLYYSRFVLKDDYAINTVVYYRGIVADLCFLPLPWVVLVVNKKIRTAVFHCQLQKSSVVFTTTIIISRNPKLTSNY